MASINVVPESGGPPFDAKLVAAPPKAVDASQHASEGAPKRVTQEQVGWATRNNAAGQGKCPTRWLCPYHGDG